ncbi:Mitochondrial carrier protein [Quillaja saponaria]|uniref:Mitochondrial carrier protein n=1 Tax=Quillaja saponaria TaxID=32244 RepID=A0AAD7L313_QUISA|nr:Mitochondrial carrier protein [Quillaja saponaria]
MREERAIVSCRSIPSLRSSQYGVVESNDHEPLWKNTMLFFSSGVGTNGESSSGSLCKFACISVAEKKEQTDFLPTPAQFLKYPLAIVALVPKDAALFFAGAVAGAAAKTVTAPLDRIKLLMQTHGVRVGQESAKKAIGFIEAITLIGKEEGIKGYWKGNLPQVALNMLREEGVASFYYGLGPSLIAIAPYIAVNFCIFDLVKKALPEKYQKRTETSLLTAVLSASLATLTCYPLDTVRRQMQLKGTPYKAVLDALPGIVERDGLIGLYRGFLPNALKTLPNSSIRLTTYDIVKRLIACSQKEFQKIMEQNRNEQNQNTDNQ